MDAAAVVTIDDDRRVRSWPAAAERLLGHPAEAMLGRELASLQAPDQPIAWLDDEEATCRLVRGDGSSLVVDVTIHRLGPGCRAVLLRDASERDRLQSEVAESQAQYQRLFTCNPYPTWVFCLDTLRFMDVNDAAVLAYGWSRDELLGGMTILDIRPPEDRPALLASFARLRETRDGRSGPWRHVHKDGAIVEVLISFHTLPFKGKLARLVVAEDVTERRRAVEKRTRLLAKIVSAQEDERRRIARELHDAVGQSLTALTVGLRALAQSVGGEAARRQLDRLRTLAADTIREVGRLSRGLRPSALDDLGLDAALTQYVNDYTATHGIAVDFDSEGAAARPLHAGDIAIYRIVQEALTNVARHAAAHRVEVRLRRPPGAIQLSVRDDGRGFRFHDDLEGLGIAGMRERAELCDGSFALESRPGEGTLIRVQLPAGGPS